MPSHRPSLDEFRQLASGYSRVPVYRELTSDGLTPVSAFRRLARSGPAFLFESVVGGEKVGRYSALGTEPSLRFEAKGSEIRLYRGTETEPCETRVSEDPFVDLQALLDQRRSVKLPNLPRFTGGAVGFAAYDSVRYTENLPDAPPDDRSLPDLAFGFYDSLVIFDHIRKTVLVIAQADCSDGRDVDLARAEAESRVDELVGRLSEPFADPPPSDIDTTGPITLQPKSNFTREQYEDVVRRCQ
ncbi:MAG TPA: anthranilate synthase component I, partial [Isosphaeraceae bacterium]|nr:anthranilate synthase component I [Isosphaeraceae bacterium]